MIPQEAIDLFERSTFGEISFVLFAAMIASALLGLALRRIPGFFVPSARRPDGQEAYIVSAVLGLLALLLGFTFSLALDRYEDRRQLVLQEANALGTAYLRTQLLPEPSRTTLTRHLHEYTVNRLELGKRSDGNVQQLLARNDDLISEIWKDTVAFADEEGSTAMTSLYVSSINAVIDLDAARLHARTTKIPSAVYAVLLAFLMLAALVLGYVLVSIWTRLAALWLFVLFTLSLLLIIDIDRPLAGTLRESQRPIEQLLQSMDEVPPEYFRSGVAMGQRHPVNLAESRALGNPTSLAS